MTTLTAADENESLGDLQVGDWRLSPRRNELQRDGKSVRLEPKAIEVLQHLARHSGEVVGREELLAAVWPGVVVGDDALTQAIIKLRKALEDDAHRPKYIETISKRGYRLIAPVVESAKSQPAPMARDPIWRRHRMALAAAAGIAAVTVAAMLAFPEIARSLRMPWPIATDVKGGMDPVSLPTVAVLPLVNLSGDPKRDYFSDGVTEDIINALGRFSGVRVMSRNAVQGFKGKTPSPKTIRTELGARYIVQGSVREANGKLRVAVELSDADKGAQLWSERYEGEGTQIFEIQDRIVKNIVGTLNVKLTEIEHQRGFAQPTESLEAHDLVLRARALLNRSERGANREARSLLARALEVAPEYVEVYTALGFAEFQRSTGGYVEDATESMRRAEAFGKRALASADPRTHVRAHALLASIYSHQNRFDEALAHAERAIEINPSESVALYWRGAALLHVGRIDEAIAELEIARRFEPHPPVGRGLSLAIAYYVAQRHAEALMQVDALLVRIPNNAVLHGMRAATLSQLGRLDEAKRAADEVRRLDPLFDAENFGARFADAKYTAQLREGLRKAGL